MVVRWLGAAGALLAVATPAIAGPPYATDDPAPTETGHWEIYSFITAEGRGGKYAGVAGLDLNYGPVPGVQLTATVPVEFEHDAGTRATFGNLELGVKYRVLNREATGVSVAIFPRVILPTSPGGGRASFLLPVWAQKQAGPWTMFGGGGYTINPGVGNRDFAVGGAALTRTLTKGRSLGVEAFRQGPDVVGGRASTLLGIGGALPLGGPFVLIASGGPTIDDGSETRWRGYVAVALNF